MGTKIDVEGTRFFEKKKMRAVLGESVAIARRDEVVAAPAIRANRPMERRLVRFGANVCSIASRSSAGLQCAGGAGQSITCLNQQACASNSA
jgi:hypothetical protein